MGKVQCPKTEGDIKSGLKDLWGSCVLSLALRELLL